MFAGKSGIGEDVWVDITEDKKNWQAFFFFLWNILVVKNQILATHF